MAMFIFGMQVALVIYNEGVLTNVIDGCYAKYLSLATPANVNLFQKFLRTAPTPRGVFILSDLFFVQQGEQTYVVLVGYHCSRSPVGFYLEYKLAYSGKEAPKK